MFFFNRLRRWAYNQQRLIFKFWDGDRVRYADPVLVGAALEAAEPEYADLLVTVTRDLSMLPAAVADDARQKRDRAVERLAAAACKALGVKPLAPDGTGVTQAEAVNLVTDYFLYMEELARDARLFRDSQRRESGSPVGSRTESSAASGTTAK